MIYHLIGLLSVSITPANASLVAVGGSLTLSCIVNHNISNMSVLSYEWFLSNRLISNNSNIILNYTNDSSVSQGGNYRCSAYYINNKGAYGYWYFTDLRGYSPRVPVLFSPSFSEEPGSIKTKVNDLIELSCTASGYPIPVIEWKRITANSSQNIFNNTVELPRNTDNDTTDAGANNITSTLIIHNIQYDDFGYYLCVATLSSSELSEDVQAISSLSIVTG